MKALKVKFMHTRDCHIWQTSLEVLKDALKVARKKAELEVIDVKTQAQANKLKFTGSPTILVNGVNVDPLSRKQRKFILSGCRTYLFKGRIYEFPQKEMVIQALKEASS